MFSASGITKASALSAQEWDKLEESAERIQKSIVGSLKTVLHEVQDALGNSSHSSLGVGGGGISADAGAQSGENNAQKVPPEGQDVGTMFRTLAQQRKTDYEQFISDMRQNAAFELRAKVQRFCKALLEGQRFSRQDTADKVQHSMGEFEDIMLGHPLWATRAPEAQERALDSLEHYVMTRLHKRIFAPDLEARQHDAALRMRIAKLQFITPEHLDIPAVNRHAGAWSRAIEALQSMSQRLTPLEKLDCVLEASQHIHSAPTLNRSAQPMSADDFLPVLVYILLRANPPELRSNVDFVSSYRAYDRLTGERAYFFTHYAGAVYFIETLDGSRLSIEPEVFDRLMEANEEDGNIYSSIVLTTGVSDAGDCSVARVDRGGGSAGGTARASSGAGGGALGIECSDFRRDARGVSPSGESPVGASGATPTFLEFRQRSDNRCTPPNKGETACENEVGCVVQKLAGCKEGGLGGGVEEVGVVGDAVANGGECGGCAVEEGGDSQVDVCSSKGSSRSAQTATAGADAPSNPPPSPAIGGKEASPTRGSSGLRSSGLRVLTPPQTHPVQACRVAAPGTGVATAKAAASGASSEQLTAGVAASISVPQTASVSGGGQGSSAIGVGVGKGASEVSKGGEHKGSPVVVDWLLQGYGDGKRDSRSWRAASGYAHIAASASPPLATVDDGRQPKGSKSRGGKAPGGSKESAGPSVVEEEWVDIGAQTGERRTADGDADGDSGATGTDAAGLINVASRASSFVGRLPSVGKFGRLRNSMEGPQGQCGVSEGAAQAICGGGKAGSPAALENVAAATNHSSPSASGPAGRSRGEEGGGLFDLRVGSEDGGGVRAGWAVRERDRRKTLEELGLLDERPQSNSTLFGEDEDDGLGWLRRS